MNILCKLRLHKWKYWDEKEGTRTVYHRKCERCNLRQTKFWYGFYFEVNQLAAGMHEGYGGYKPYKWAGEKEGEHWTQLGNDGAYQRFK